MEKIGYGGIPRNFTAPLDRRSFCFWAPNRKVDFELADPSKQYDLVVLTQMADLSQWVIYPYKQTKIVFDFVDSYLVIPCTDWRGFFYSLRSRIKYGYKHFDWFSATLLVAGTIFLEPFCRLALAIRRRSGKEAKETIKAYVMLWHSMPELFKNVLDGGRQ